MSAEQADVVPLRAEFDEHEPPNDINAEQCVLGSMLLAPDLIGDLQLAGDDFWRPAHETLHAVIVDMYRQGKPVDAVTVAAELTERKLIAKVGGHPYLHTLISSVPTTSNAEHYARIVRDRAVRRRMQQAARRVLQLSTAHADDVDELVGVAQSALLALDSQAADAPQLIEELLQPALDGVEATQAHGPSGLPSPWMDLNEILDPLSPGDLVIVGARPAIGKSVIGLDWARDVAVTRKLPAAVFSLEMSKRQITLRLMAAECRIPLRALVRGEMTEEHWGRLAQRLNPLAEAPLFIDDSANLTITSIRAKARRLKAKHGLSLIVVDYLQLIPTSAKAENRQTAVAEMSRGLKLLGRELEVPVIALSQLNRSVEGRTEKRPTLSDLRESGAIEQDADAVILLHREDVYDRDSPRQGEMDLIVAKQRQGPTGTAAVAFQGHYVRVADMARPWSEQ